MKEQVKTYQARPIIDRRKFTTALVGAFCIPQTIFAAESQAIAEGRKIDLLQDAEFHRGFDLIKIEPKSKEIAGSLAGTEPGKPAWRLAQWSSKFNLLGAQPEKLEDGSIRYFDGAKSVTLGAPGGKYADIVLALNGVKEYQNVALQQHVPWPHLLVERTVAENPALTELSEIPFQISYKLLRAEPHRREGWDNDRHTAQFLFYVTVQNFNRSSPGFHDYLWLNVPFFDARYPYPKKDQRTDTGNSKFMFSPGGEIYTKQKARDGEWITVQHDLLPLIKDALHAAWNAGYLKGSKNIEDYHLGGVNLGWEVTGPWDVAMQVRGLDFKAVIASNKDSNKRQN